MWDVLHRSSTASWVTELHWHHGLVKYPSSIVQLLDKERDPMLRNRSSLVDTGVVEGRSTKRRFAVIHSSNSNLAVMDG